MPIEMQRGSVTERATYIIHVLVMMTNPLICIRVFNFYVPFLLVIW
jgi:hypothetical protein